MSNLLKYLKSRTVTLNVLVAVLVALLEAAPTFIPALQGVIPAATYAWLTVAVNVANIVLRTVTTQPLADRVNPPAAAAEPAVS